MFQNAVLKVNRISIDFIIYLRSSFFTNTDLIDLIREAGFQIYRLDWGNFYNLILKSTS